MYRKWKIFRKYACKNKKCAASDFKQAARRKQTPREIMRKGHRAVTLKSALYTAN